MDFQDLLDEVEGAMKSDYSTSHCSKSTSVRASTSIASKIGNNSSLDEELYGSSNSTTKPISTNTSSSNKKKNELDDLLDMMNDSEEEISHCSSRVTSRTTMSTSTIKKEEPFQIGGNRKCFKVVLHGANAKRGLNTAVSSQSACSNLRCNDCDFTVCQFIGKKWDASADYMFFRENVPSETKLSRKMENDSFSVAYACQCKWQSIQELTLTQQISNLKWSCAGHF